MVFWLLRGAFSRIVQNLPHELPGHVGNAAMLTRIRRKQSVIQRALLRMSLYSVGVTVLAQ